MKEEWLGKFLSPWHSVGTMIQDLRNTLSYLSDEKVKSNFCPVPFMQLLFHPNGDVNPCCWNMDIRLGNVQNKSLEEIWNGPELQSLRQEFLTGEIKSCQKQIECIGCHKYFERFLSQIQVKTIQDRMPVRLDLRLSGLCNLRCIMCNVWEEPTDVYRKLNFISENNKLLDQVREIDLLGGEPFVQQESFDLLEMISKNRPQCTWAFSSNLSFELTPRLRSLFDTIQIRWFQCSLDSLKAETYPKIRVNGRLEKVLQNIDELRTIRDEKQKRGEGFRIVLTMAVQQLNWKEIPNFLKFCKDKQAEAVFQDIIHPAECALASLSLDEQAGIYEYIISSVSPEDISLYLKPIVIPLETRLKAQITQG